MKLFVLLSLVGLLGGTGLVTTNVTKEATPKLSKTNVSTVRRAELQEKPTPAEGLAKWDGTTVSTALSQNESGAYEISSGADLAFLATKVTAKDATYLNANYVFTSDIDLDSKPLDIIGTYQTDLSQAMKGTIDGNNHVIFNYKNKQTVNGALFGYINGTLKNLTMTGTMTGTNRLAAFARCATGNFQNLVSWVDINCTFTTTKDVKNNGWIGGILAATHSNNGTVRIENCTNYGNISYNVTFATERATNAGYVGGICGYIGWGSQTTAKGVVTGCHNYGNITGTNAQTLGGVVGMLRKGVLSDCENHGTITSNSELCLTSRIAGIVGQAAYAPDADNLVNLTNLDNYGDVIVNGPSDSVGGIAGCIGDLNDYPSGIANCNNYGNVAIDGDITSVENKFDQFIGGVVGMMNTKEVDSCVNEGNITFSGEKVSYLGGVIGEFRNLTNKSLTYDTLTVKNSINRGAISVNTTGSQTGPAFRIGGIAGGSFDASFRDIINNSKNYGSITATSENSNATTDIGGIVGLTLASDIDNCENEGNVDTTGCVKSNYVAGIVGRTGAADAHSTVSNCINRGNIHSPNTSAGNGSTAGIAGQLTNSSILSGVNENYGDIVGGIQTALLVGYAGPGCVVDLEHAVIGGTCTNYQGEQWRAVGHLKSNSGDTLNGSVLIVKKFGALTVGQAAVLFGTTYTSYDANVSVEGRTLNGWYLDADFNTKLEDGASIDDLVAELGLAPENDKIDLEIYGKFALPKAEVIQMCQDADTCNGFMQVGKLRREISYLTDAEQAEVLATSFEDRGGYTVTIEEKLLAMEAILNGDTGAINTSLLANVDNNMSVIYVLAIVAGAIASTFILLKVIKRRARNRK